MQWVTPDNGQVVVEGWRTGGDYRVAIAVLLVITRPGHLVPRDLVDDFDVEEKEWTALMVTSGVPRVPRDRDDGVDEEGKVGLIVSSTRWLRCS